MMVRLLAVMLFATSALADEPACKMPMRPSHCRPETPIKDEYQRCVLIDNRAMLLYADKLEMMLACVRRNPDCQAPTPSPDR